MFAMLLPVALAFLMFVVGLGLETHHMLGVLRQPKPLLVGLEGAGALHLADLAIGGLGSSAWDQQPDRRGQVLGWLASEPVILGLTLVGGVHLDDGQLGAALDVMLGLEPDPQ